MNTLELKRFLAEQLKEKIRFEPAGKADFGGNYNIYFAWQKTGIKVLDTEWDYIVRLVEGKLTEVQLHEYRVMLYKQFRTAERFSNIRFEEWLIRLDWPTRAEALMKILKP